LEGINRISGLSAVEKRRWKSPILVERTKGEEKRSTLRRRSHSNATNTQRRGEKRRWKSPILVERMKGEEKESTLRRRSHSNATNTFTRRRRRRRMTLLTTTVVSLLTTTQILPSRTSALSLAQRQLFTSPFQPRNRQRGLAARINDKASLWKTQRNTWIAPPSSLRTSTTRLFAARDHEKRRQSLWKRTRNPWIQLALVFVLYTFHLTVLTQHQIVWPIQWLALKSSSSLINYRHFCGLGYDSLAGMLSLLLYCGTQRNRRRLSPLPKQMPWKFPSATTDNSSQNGDNKDEDNTAQSQNVNTTALSTANWPAIVHRGTFLITTALLVTAYFGTGRLSLFWQDTLYQMSAAGWSLTAPLFRAWTVLLGHMSWVAVGTCLLASIPRSPRFFATASQNKNDNNSVERSNHWFRFDINNSHWWLWVVGGYFVSSWLFNVADWANNYILPAQVLQLGSESSVVSQLVAPENNDRAASIIGYIAPCITAPVWEEVLYRGFLLAGLTQWTNNFQVAAILQAIVFSAHHMSMAAGLPLAVLGWTWAVLYRLSGNLWTVCLVHALWNSRVFLGSWLGL
jgi:membrane protease YdiL (CAAX protease family)